VIGAFLVLPIARDAFTAYCRARRQGKRPNRGGNLEHALEEVLRMARRREQRLRQAVRMQRTMGVLAFALLFGIVAWSVVLVTRGQAEYAQVIGTSGIVATIITSTIWKPFALAGRANMLADGLETYTVGLVASIETVSQIDDPVRRREEIARVVSDCVMRKPHEDS
jgi:hypothetical protein